MPGRRPRAAWMAAALRRVTTMVRATLSCGHMGGVGAVDEVSGAGSLSPDLKVMWLDLLVPLSIRAPRGLRPLVLGLGQVGWYRCWYSGNLRLALQAMMRAMPPTSFTLLKAS
jgi:hypothetical protein